MKVAITGGHGFLGWHIACRLLGTRGLDPARLGRRAFMDPARLAESLMNVDTVIHVAGVNRAETDDEVERGNVLLAEQLATALDGRPVHLVYANSVQANLDNHYGRGKRRAGEILAGLPGTMADVLLPNLFGEHGRPSYNSFVATFADAVANGREPVVSGDRKIELLHAQGAAKILIAAAGDRSDQRVRAEGEAHGISEVRDMLKHFHSLYAERGEIPDLFSEFARDLFNTYRAARFPDGYPIYPQVHSDQRGELAEVVRSHGGTGQAFVSTTRPGHLRGDHWHLRKIERFMVVQGEAEIAVRRLYSDEIVRFNVTGDRPCFVDMPTMWVHNIRNIGQTELMTVFWADQLLDPDDPDQFSLLVEEGPK